MSSALLAKVALRPEAVIETRFWGESGGDPVKWGRQLMMSASTG